MVNINEQYAYFAITGDFDPSDITARVGVEPSECWRRGDICPKRQMERKFSRWALYSCLSRDQELEAHIRNVLAQLEVNRQDFKEISQEFGGVMQLVAYLHTYDPGLHFDTDITDGLARFSLEVDFDFYWLVSDVRETT